MKVRGLKRLFRKEICLPILTTIISVTMMGAPVFAGFWNSPTNYVSAKSLVYVCNADSGNISVIDGVTGVISKTITLPTGARPLGIAFRPDYCSAYVTDENSKIHFIHDNDLSDSIDTSPNNPCHIAIHPNGKFAYISSDGGILILDISPKSLSFNTIIGTIGGLAYTDGMVFTPDGTRAYIAIDGSWGAESKVHIVDTSSHSIVHTIQLPIPTSPLGVAASPDGTRVYVVGWTRNNVSVIDSDPSSATYNTVTAVISVAGRARSIALSPSGNLAYVTLDTGGVDVIVTAPSSSQYHQVIDHINAGPYNGIHDVAISLDGRFTYVTVCMTGANQLYMVDSEPFSATFNTLIKNITVGNCPAGVAVRPMMIDCARENLCKGDFNGDGDVDASDLAVFAAEFGRTDCLVEQETEDGIMP
jgi:YVTN family beta-propeller protein